MWAAYHTYARVCFCDVHNSISRNSYYALQILDLEKIETQLALLKIGKTRETIERLQGETRERLQGETIERLQGGTRERLQGGTRERIQGET